MPRTPKSRHTLSGSGATATSFESSEIETPDGGETLMGPNVGRLCFVQVWSVSECTTVNGLRLARWSETSSRWWIGNALNGEFFRNLVLAADRPELEQIRLAYVRQMDELFDLAKRREVPLTPYALMDGDAIPALPILKKFVQAHRFRGACS